MCAIKIPVLILIYLATSESHDPLVVIRSWNVQKLLFLKPYNSVSLNYLQQTFFFFLSRRKKNKRWLDNTGCESGKFNFVHKMRSMAQVVWAGGNRDRCCAGFLLCPQSLGGRQTHLPVRRSCCGLLLTE